MRSNRSIPDTQIIPELSYPDIESAADWLCKAFGFRKRLVIGDHRIQLEFGSGALIVRKGPPVRDEAASHAVMMRVEDVDAHYARATAAGAFTAGAPVSYPYGERQYRAEDLAGHSWVFTQSVQDVDPREWGGKRVDGE